MDALNNIEERKKSLLTFINEEFKANVTIEDIHYNRNEHGTDDFGTPVGTFYVFTDEEADKFVAEDVENLIWEFKGDLSCFNPFEEYVRDTYLSWDGGKEWWENDYQDYLANLEDEKADDDRFPNKLAEVLYQSQMEIENTDDLEDYGSDDFIKQWLEDDYTDIDTLKEEYINKKINEMNDDYLGEYLLRFGNDSLTTMIDNGDVTVDYEGIAEWSCGLTSRGDRVCGTREYCILNEDNDTEYYLYQYDDKPYTKDTDKENEEYDR